MTTSTNLPLYRLLVKGGASEADAEAAASFDASALATKADLLTAVADLKAELTWRYIVILGAQTAIFSAIVAALKFVP